MQLYRVTYRVNGQKKIREVMAKSERKAQSKVRALETRGLPDGSIIDLAFDPCTLVGEQLDMTSQIGTGLAAVPSADRSTAHGVADLVSGGADLEIGHAKKG